MKILFIILTLLCGHLYSQNNCPSTAVCVGFSNTPSGAGAGGQFGEISAATDGCLSGEHNSTWITVTILTSGTFQFIINPNVNSNDFDFAIWGPGSGCPPTGTPIRCNFALNTGNTGLNGVATGTSEDAVGVKWCQQMNVIAGETYLILIDNFTTNSGFAMTFGGTSTLDCAILPIDLTSFNVHNNNFWYNEITWSTASELNNDYFFLERSLDGNVWNTIYTTPGAGNSSSELSYSFRDYDYADSINYYRLTQVDYNGDHETFDVISIDNRIDQKTIVKVINFIGQEVSPEYEGLRIIIYSDGSTSQVIGK